MEKLLKLSVNPSLIDKPIDLYHSNMGFSPAEFNIEELAEVAKMGFCFSYQFVDGIRKAQNFIASDFIAIDIDDGWVIQDASKNPTISSYCSLLYTTSSHTPDHPRFRLVFVLPRTITDANEMKAATRALATRLGGDMNATDAARMFYGSTDCYQILMGKQISDEFLVELIEDGRSESTSDTIADNGKVVPAKSYLTLDASFEIRTSKNQLVKFSEFQDKESVYCPFHPDNNPSAFVAINVDGFHYLFCSTCQSTRWIDGSHAVFDFNHFVKTLKHYQEESPKKRSKVTSPIEQLLYDDVRFHNKHVHFSEERYFKLGAINKGITFIKSPKGTGKTTFLRDALKSVLYKFGSGTLADLEENTDPEIPESIYTNKRVLLIGHRQALIREMCQKLGLECYLDDSRESKSAKRKHSRYGVCLDSLHLAIDKGDKNSAATTKYDVVIIDESEQVLSHFLSETIGEKRVEIFDQLTSLLNNAKSIVALDADLGWITFNTVTRLANKDGETPKPINIYINEWVENQRPINIHPTSNQLIHHLKQNVIDGKQIFVSSNSKAKIKTLEKSILDLASKLGRNIPMITVTSENSKTKEVQKFITNVKSEIKNYQVILSSPSLGTGIDITFDNNADEIDCVYGLYENRINTHTEIDQQLGRVRNPKEVHVWISPRWFNFETEFEVIKDDYLKNNYLVNFYNQHETASLSGLTSSRNVSPFLMMATLITVYQRASKNNLKAHFIHYKKSQGWQIIEEPDDDLSNRSGKSFLKVGKAALLQEEIDQILSAKPLSKGIYSEIIEGMDSNDQIVTRDNFFSYLRTKIELFYRMPISKDLVVRDQKGQLRKGIATFEKVTDLDFIKNVNDYKLQTQGDKKTSRLTEKILPNRNSGLLLLSELLSKTPVFKDGKFDSDFVFESKDLIDFAKLAIKLKPYIENHLGINIRKDIKDKPVQQFGEILKLVGLEHWKTGAQVINNEKVYFYKISPHQLSFVKKIVVKRKILEDPWLSFNKRHGFSDDFDNDIPDFFKKDLKKVDAKTWL